jgi:AbrB family looped-hinge helix DNA binding protein
MIGIDVVVRPKRQVTLPKEICEQLGIAPGDTLEFNMEGSVLVARLKKARALDAVREIRAMFKASGITEAELQDSGREIRKEVARRLYRAKP